MKPGFALLLSHDGLTLSHRTSEGWLRIGEVSLDAPDVAGALAELRVQAVEIAKARNLAPLRTKLVLPNSEVLYHTVSVEGVTSPDYDGAIRDSLDGRTPYALDELCYDYVVSGSEAQVAVVARETLAEAEAFAVEHRLAPVCFAAVPPKGAFSGEVMFGTTKAAEHLLGPGEMLERDMAPVVLLGEAQGADAPGPASEPAPLPKPKPPAAQAEAADPAAGKTGAAKAPDKAAQAAVEGTEPAAEDAPKPSFASARTRDGAAVPSAPSPEAPQDPMAPRINLSAEVRSKVETPPAPPPPAEPKTRPVGLLLTVALLVVMVLVGVFAALTGGDEAAETRPPPAEETTPEAVAAPTPEQAPRQTAEEGPPVADEDSGDAVAEAAPDAATPPVVAMTTGPEALAPATPSSPFASLPTPEEVAEGDEANVADAPTQDMASLPDAPGLPDIDALPVDDTPPPSDAADPQNPGLIETETRYAATGIWQRSPDPLLPLTPPGIEDLYVAALDSDIAIEDALALPAYRDDRDLRPVTPRPPIAPGQFFELDADGLVPPTPDGALTPDGVLVFSDPEVRPDPRPGITPATTDADILRETLSGLRPPPRPENATELRERAVLDGRSRAELASVAPPARPASIQDLAEAPDAAEAEASGMASSLVPDARPSDFAARVASLRAARTQARAEAPSGSRGSAPSASLAAVAPPAPAPEVRETAPSIPTTASVARQATLENALPLNRINLIGVYGTPNSRRALIRLASGRYVKVEVGDRVDGGRVAAIGEASVQYTKGGRNITLEMPRG